MKVSLFACRSKISSELAKVINDGLYYYEQDLVNEEGQVGIPHSFEIEVQRS